MPTVTRPRNKNNWTQANPNPVAQKGGCTDDKKGSDPAVCSNTSLTIIAQDGRLRGLDEIVFIEF